MKKLIFGISMVSLALLVIFGALYVIDQKRMDENKPVLFSTWGAKYAPIVEITPEIAVEKVKETLGLEPETVLERLLNYDNPEVREMVFDKQPGLDFIVEEINLVGKPLYEVTFNSSIDAMVGPLVVYVDKSTGVVIGHRPRM